MQVCLFCMVLLCLQLLIGKNEGARILGVFPVAAPSHYILGSTLLKGLAESGHDITIISPYSAKNPPKNGSWREIVVDELIEFMNQMFEESQLLKMGNIHPVLATFFMSAGGNIMTEQLYNHTKVQKLISSGEKFDVVIVGQFVNDGVKALANHFGGHLVLFSNTAANSWLNHFVGNPSLPSYFPELLLHMPKRMSFIERLENTMFKLVYELNQYLYFYPKQNTLVRKYIPSPADLYDSMYNISLVLLNSHISIFNPQSLVPCMVEIGGFHITPPKKLPDDLQNFLDAAKEGVIYFSMGSNLKSIYFSEQTRDAILKSLGKRKEKVLWKYEDDVLPGQPSNIKIGKWLPQQDILAHPNVKVFITHGGLLSNTETIYHGVPIIAIPIYGDQNMNAYTAQDAGYGLVVPFQELSEERLSSALEEIIANPKYRESAQERSRIMKDRQIDPLQNAIYWIEYVIRHNGAKHLRVAYLDLYWFQYYLLDVIGFIFLVIFVSIFILKKIFSYGCRRWSSTQKIKQN